MKWEFQLAYADQAKRKAELDIYDAVGDPYSGVTSRGVLSQLRYMDVDQILVRVNSIGGVVSEGFDIFNMLKEHPAKVTTRISGIAASIASIIALAGDAVEMYENSQYMVHDPYAQFEPFGPPMREADLRRSADLLASMRSQMYAIYCSKTGKAETEIQALCAAETWMTGKLAKELGFVDRLLTGGEENMLTMKASAKAWEPKVFAFLRNVPQSIRIAAQAARPGDSSSGNPQLTTVKKVARRRVMNRIQLASATSAAAILAALVPVVAKMKAGDDGISDDEIKDLASQLEESAALAEETEKELEASKQRCSDYEATKKALEEANSRGKAASDELEDVKKKMAELKNAGKAEDEGEEPEAAADDEKELGAAEASAFHSASKRELRAIARAAMQLCGVKTFKALEGRLMAFGTRVQQLPDRAKVRAELVDGLISKKKLVPAKRDWALKASEENLNAYLEGIGETPIVAGAYKPGVTAASAHNAGTPGAQLNGSDNRPQGDVLPNGLTRQEEELRVQFGLSVEKVIAQRSQPLASAAAPKTFSFS